MDMVNWNNIEWLIHLWDEIPEPTLDDGLKALCLLYAELDTNPSSEAD